MGLFSKIFSSSDDDKTIKLRHDDSDNSRRTGDVYTKTDDGGHVHESYNQSISANASSYSEYHGGENSEDRSYKK